MKLALVKLRSFHHKNWLTYSGGTDRPGKLCYNFLSQMTLPRSLTFLLWSLTVSLTVLLFWIYLFLLILVFFFYNGFPSNGKFWSCSCLSFHWVSIKITMGYPVSLHSLWLFSCWMRWSSWSFERCCMGGCLNSVLLLLLIIFLSQFHLPLMYISLIISMRSSLIHLHDYHLLVLLP